VCVGFDLPRLNNRQNTVCVLRGGRNNHIKGDETGAATTKEDEVWLKRDRHRLIKRPHPSSPELRRMLHLACSWATTTAFSSTALLHMLSLPYSWANPPTLLSAQRSITTPPLPTIDHHPSTPWLLMVSHSDLLGLGLLAPTTAPLVSDYF